MSKEIKEAFIGRAKKYNHFAEQGSTNDAHSCATCVRRQFSFPWTCNDGWPAGNPRWEDRGDRCMNWTDQGNAPVD